MGPRPSHLTNMSSAGPSPEENKLAMVINIGLSPTIIFSYQINPLYDIELTQTFGNSQRSNDLFFHI